MLYHMVLEQQTEYSLYLVEVAAAAVVAVAVEVVAEAAVL
jgi:hypothetical protein